MEQLLLDFIHTMDLSLRRIQEEIGDRPGFAKLTLNQFRYIDAIYNLGEPAVSELAARLNITKASVTAGVDKLARLGYVIKTQSSGDRRVVHLKLTPTGAQLVEAKYRAIRQYGDFIRSALDEVEARQFEDTLAKLVQIFQHTHPILNQETE